MKRDGLDLDQLARLAKRRDAKQRLQGVLTGPVLTWPLTVRAAARGG
jgi:hypothetical protein